MVLSSKSATVAEKGPEHLTKAYTVYMIFRTF